jgi:hypothetical protein
MSSLNALINQAVRANPADRLISPMGEGSYTTLFGIVSDGVAVMRMALEIDHHPERVKHWYAKDAIRELGGLTAKTLVSMGRADAVVSFLQSIRSGERG